MMKVTVGRKLVISYSLILLLMSILAILSYSSMSSMQKQTDEIIMDAIPLGQEAAEILTSLVNQETGVRGYLLSADESFLEPYKFGREEVKNSLTIINTHLASHPIMAELIQRAKPQIENIEQYFESQIELVKKGQRQEANSKLADGKKLFDDFRATYADIQKDIDKLTNDAWLQSKQTKKQAEQLLLLISLLALLGVSLSGYLLNQSISKPIQKVTESVERMAEGDLSIDHLHIKNKDEIGVLASSFNRMADNLRSLVYQIGHSTEQVASSAEQLTASSEQTAKASEYISSSMQKVAAGVESQTSSVEQTIHTVDRMVVGVHKAVQIAEAVASSTGTASEKTSEGNSAIATASRQMNFINETMSKLVRAIKQFEHRSREIGQITAAITEISSQTNLLALNAAIEAAKAGEQGRGFSVVAQEVKQLAEQSTQSAHQITDVIGKIQLETEEVIRTMEDAAKEVAEGIQSVSTAGMSFEQIRSSVDEVTTHTEQIFTAVQLISAGAEQVVSSIHYMGQLAGENAAASQNVSSSTEEQLASMEEISASSLHLTKLAEDLHGLTLKFKL
ncbi:methyl-accepting chemotaxis protein [Paenibacillus puerhi]|uniref:methyl-accepting chemotaxis protein n=1 Tax=Paenibacillus puerhi TaxID=2692622 RepID=UPI001359832B|nr:methyl-accepting chemotaxis protein [Paenibacillus puerhi]